MGRGFDEEALPASSPSSRHPTCWGFHQSVRIYFATSPVDMGNGVDGLRTIVEQLFRRNPNDGHLVVSLASDATCSRFWRWDRRSKPIVTALIDPSGRSRGSKYGRFEFDS